MDPRGHSEEQSRGNYLDKLDCKQNSASLPTVSAQTGGTVVVAVVCVGWGGGHPGEERPTIRGYGGWQTPHSEFRWGSE